MQNRDIAIQPPIQIIRKDVWTCLGKQVIQSKCLTEFRTRFIQQRDKDMSQGTKQNYYYLLLQSKGLTEFKPRFSQWRNKDISQRTKQNQQSSSD